MVPNDASSPAGALTEIRWHARGGQGAKTAATFLAESAVDAGFYAQGFPEYGPERMGAPVRAYNRISGKPIRVNAPVTSPGIVVLMDETLLKSAGIDEGTSQDTVFLVNTAAEPDDKLRHRLAEYAGPDAPLWILDANRLATETIGRPIPNTPMVGAMLRATGILPVDTVIEAVRHKLSKKFSAKIVDGNIEAVRRAYEEAQRI